jgi:hypothetical protein
MRKRWPLWVLMVGVIATAIGILWSLSPHTSLSVTRHSFDQIREGMTVAEVERILGRPPGKYTDRHVYPVMSGVSHRRWWIGDEGIIEISFTSDDKSGGLGVVWKKEFDPLPPESFIDKCRRKCRDLWPW